MKFIKIHQHGKDTLRVTSVVLTLNKWEVRSIDIKIAFFQGSNISRYIHVKPLFKANCDKKFVWKLRKCVYKLSHASLK